MSNVIDIRLITDEKFLPENYSIQCKSGRRIRIEEIPNIYSAAGNASLEDFMNAMEIIIAFMAQKEYYHVVGDIDEIECQLNPTRKMTLDEIEKELGYKVQLVANTNEKED